MHFYAVASAAAPNGVSSERIAEGVRPSVARASWSLHGVPHGGKVVGGGVFRCCVPWCGARTAASVDDADHALREGSPQLSHHELGKSHTCII